MAREADVDTKVVYQPFPYTLLDELIANCAAVYKEKGAGAEARIATFRNGGTTYQYRKRLEAADIPNGPWLFLVTEMTDGHVKRFGLWAQNMEGQDDDAT